MNIFAVDDNPVLAARDLPDQLVRKMPLESCQMLAYWAHYSQGVKVPKKDGEPYKVGGSHRNHPCTLWLYVKVENVKWLLEHGLALCDEWKRRKLLSTGLSDCEPHGCQKSLTSLLGSCPFLGALESSLHSPFVQCMPDEYKSEDPVSSYREFLLGDKGYASWKIANPPSWWDEEKHRPARVKYLAEKIMKQIHSNARKAKNSNPSRRV